MTTPATPPSLSFLHHTIEQLDVQDERSFRHVALYTDLKEVLRRAKYPFRILPKGPMARWDRALLLNLTYWGANEGGDVLVDSSIEADVVAHAAWHYLAAKALPASPSGKVSASALFMGEAIASAFDLYLVGRLLGHAPESSFLDTQVPAMVDSAEVAGVTGEAFEALLDEVSEDPEAAFESLRQLLFEATSALYSSRDASEALKALSRFEGHRFSCLLSRYELSNWVLYARAYATDGATDARVRELDEALRAAKDSVEWLTKAWVYPALGESAGA